MISKNRKKQPLVLNIGYNLLNLSLGLFQTCSHSFTDFDDTYPYKIALTIKEYKIFPLVTIKIGSLNDKCVEYF